MSNQNEDLSWYFILRMFIISAVWIGYISFNYYNDLLSNFGITTLLFFLPFILDYALKEKGKEIDSKVKNIAIGIPICTAGAYFAILAFFSNSPEFPHMKVPFLIKCLYFLLSLFFVVCSFLDYNYYSKNKKEAINDRGAIKNGVDKQFVTNFKTQVQQVEKNKKEGFKEVATKAQKKKKKHGRQ